MKVKEFRENYELDTNTKRGVKARSKNGSTLPELNHSALEVQRF